MKQYIYVTSAGVECRRHSMQSVVSHIKTIITRLESPVGLLIVKSQLANHVDIDRDRWIKDTEKYIGWLKQYRIYRTNS